MALVELFYLSISFYSQRTEPDCQLLFGCFLCLSSRWVEGRRKPSHLLGSLLVEGVPDDEYFEGITRQAMIRLSWLVEHHVCIQ